MPGRSTTEALHLLIRLMEHYRDRKRNLLSTLKMHTIKSLRRSSGDVSKKKSPNGIYYSYQRQ